MLASKYKRKQERGFYLEHSNFWQRCKWTIFSPSDFYTIVIFTMKAWLINLYGKHSKFSKVTFAPCSLNSSNFSHLKKYMGSLWIQVCTTSWIAILIFCFSCLLQLTKNVLMIFCLHYGCTQIGYETRIPRSNWGSKTWWL